MVVLLFYVQQRHQKIIQKLIFLLPLIIEKAFQLGRYGGFLREKVVHQKETLTARLIDRPIRPLFHKNFKRETQIIATVLEYDFENDPDIVALLRRLRH